MAGGYRGPLFLLGLSAAAAIEQGGFRQPLPVPPVSGTAAPTQAGFRQPLPIPPVAGSPVPVQGGFRQPLPIPPVAGGTAVEPPPADDTNLVVRYGDRWTEDEDEELMLIITAFLATRR